MKKLLCLLLIVLAGVMGVCAAPVALSEETVDLCPDLAVCGGMIWRVRNATRTRRRAVSRLCRRLDGRHRIADTGREGRREPTLDPAD